MGQISAAAFTAYDPTTASSIVAGPLALYTVNVGSIDPTQLNEGYAEVGKKASAYDLETAAQVQASLLASIEPVVIGPGGQLYLTDGHHTFTALDDSIFGASNPIVYVNVIANYSNLTTAQFFAQMQAGNLLLPLDNGVAQTVNTSTGAPIPTSLTALTNDPYRGLEYSILKNKNSKLFTTTSNITGATGTSTPGLDKMTGFYSDFLEAAAYRTANGGLGLSYLSPGDIALSSQWNLNASSTFTLPNVTGTVTAAQLPGFILAQSLVQGSNIAPTVISNATLANGALDGNGTFTGITTINAGTAANPITIGTPNTGFIMQVGADRGFTVTLNGNNTYTGGTSILAGTLIITSDAALGAAATGGAIDTTNLKTSVQAANGIIFNSLSEGNGTLQIGTASGAGTATFTTNRVIAVGSEAATINLNGYLVSLTGQLYSLGTAGVGIGNATGFSDITIDDNSSNKGVLTLSTASPNFYGNVIIGNNNKPTVRVMSDAALGATTGSVYEIGQVVLNGGTLQAGASFTANERNISLTSGSTIDTAGFTTSWGSLSDTQRTITIANSSGTAGAITFASFNVASSATLALTGSETTTFTNGIQRSGTASLIIQPTSSSSLASTEKLMSGTGAASVVDGIAPAWIVTNSGVSSAAGPYDFVTYGANGYVKATYGSTTLSSSTGTTSVALAANTTASGNLAAYALNTSGKTITLGSNTLTIGDGTSADAAGLILASGSAISGGTLAFGGSEGVIWLSGSSPTISSTITGSDGLTFSGSGSVALTAAANLSGVVTVNSGTVTLGAANVFASDAGGILLQDTKSTPAKATLAITANNAITTLDSAGTNSAITVATGTTLTIGDTTTNLSSTLSSTITGSGTATIVKAGSGLLDLSAGKVTSISTISATGGQLRVAVGTSGSVNYALSNGADLQFAQNGGGQYSGAITGAGTLHLIGGTLQLTGTANTYSGGTIVETGSTLDLTTANVSSGNANITDAGGLIVFDQATSGTFSGVVSDGKEMGTGPMLSGSLLKDDSTGGNSGNLTLSAAQTYTGGTYVEAGTLTLGVTDAVATSSGVTLGRVSGGATATLALGANETVAALTSDASNTTSVKLNGFTLTVAAAAGTTSAFGGTIVDGTAAGQVVKSGAGTLVLSGANTYSGGTNLASGTLDLANVGAGGTGAITFGTGAQTLDIEQASLNADGSFTNTLAGFGTGDTIDLRGIGSETSASFNATTNKLTLSGGNETTILQLDGAAPAGYGYGLTSDGQGGTLLALDQKATVASLSTSPASGYVKAGQTVTITITTSKAVSISGTNPILNLAGGGTATFTGIDATGTQLTFTDTVASGQDASGIQVTSITNAGSIQDAAHVAADLSGAVNQTPTGPVIDTTAPSVAITSTAGLTNSATQTISGTANTPDNSTVTIYETYNGATNAIGTATVTNGAFSQSIHLSSGNGTHTIYATDTDAAGNTGTSPSVSYDLETTAPSITLTSTGGLTNNSMQTIVGTVDTSADPQAANSAISITDTSTGNVLATGTTDGAGRFSIGVSLVGDGTHALQVQDTDQAQNSSFASISYTLDTTAPTPPTVALAHDTGTSATDGITNDPTIVYTPSASGDTLLYAVDGSTAYTTTQPVFATDGTQDGTHTVSVEERDPAGNISSATNLTFTLDTLAPTTTPSIALLHDTGTSQVDGITNDPTLAVSVGTSGDTLLYKADGATTYSTTAPTFATNGTQDGQHKVTVAEEDAAGNIGPATSLTFTLDTVAPGAPSVALANDTGTSNSDGITNDPTLKVTPSASGDTLLYKADGATTYSTTAPTFQTDGTHTVLVEEEDAAGNISAPATLTFTLDTTPPTVSFTSMGGNVNSAAQTVNGFAGVDNAGTVVSIYQDGSTTPAATATVQANGYFSASVTLSGNGAHTLTASDTDKAGNTGTTAKALTYNLDTSAPTFTAGNLVISISGDGDGSGSYGDNQASPLVLQQITTAGVYVNQIVLPQTTTTVNGVTESVISAEYGSSSEGLLELSGDGHSLTIAGYGVNAQTYNTGGAAVYGDAALAQSTSVPGGQYTPVTRVIADVDANGSIDTSTALYNVYNTNNPRSVATTDGTSFYISGQGVKGDTTQGVFLVQDGGTTATSIDHTTDTRIVEIINGQLYVSRDSKQPSGGSSNIAVYGSTLPTSTATASVLPGINKTVALNGSNGNTVNGSSGTANLDPEQYFFANATTLYVADGGVPKAGGEADGGLQKWVYNGTQWTLQYTLSQGLNIAQPGASAGTTGLIGLTGQVNADGTVSLYATNETVGDLDQKYVFGITDTIAATSAAGESFTTLVTAAAGTNIRGIAFAPTALTPTVALAHDTGTSASDNITNNATLTITKARSSDSLLYSLNGSAYSSTVPTFGADGTYMVSVEEVDTSGKAGPASSLTFTLDTTADVGGDLKVALPSGVNAANAATASFTISGLDADATATVTFSGTGLDGNAKTVAVNETANGTYSVNLSGFKDGSVAAAIAATDTAGNHATGTGATTVLDTTADAGGDLAVAFGTTNASVVGDVNAAHAAAAGFTVSGLDADATAQVTFSGTGLDGNAKSVTVGETANGTFTVDLSGFKDGAITAAIQATDTAGNHASGAGATTTLDTSADVGSDLAIAFGSNAAASGEIDAAHASAATFTVSGLDSDATATVTFSGTAAGGSGAKSVVVTEAANGSYTADLSGFADGRITASIRANDTAGNSANGAGTTAVLDTSANAGASLAVSFGANAAVTGEVNAAHATSAAFSVTGLDADATATVTFTGTAVGGAAKTVTENESTNGSYAVDLSGFADGTVTAAITAHDTAGNSATGTGAVAILDTTADAGGDLAVVFGNNASTAGTINGAHAAAAAFTVSGLDADATATLTFSGLAADGSAKSVTVGESANASGTVDLSGFQDGSISVAIAAVDSAGNSANGHGTTATLDATVPATAAAPTLTAASDSGASASDGVTNVATPTFTGTAEAGTTVRLLDSDGTTLGTAVVGATGGYSITASHLADGTHMLSVTVTDTAGNVSTASPATSIVVDTSAPSTPAAPMLAAASDSGTSSSDRITNVATPTLSGSAEANSTVKLYDGTTVIGSAVAGAGGTYSITPTTALADGTHALSVTATDLAGNVSQSSPTTSVTIDTKAPVTPATPTLATASDSGTSSSDGVTNVTTPVVNGTAEAGSTVVLYDTDGTTVLGTAVAATNGAYSITSSALAQGSHVLSVKATDVAGNTSAVSGSLTILVDTTAPVRPAAPSMTAASDSGTSSTDGITKIKTPTLTGSAEIGSTVTLFDGSAQIAKATVGATGTYSITTSALSDGTHVLTVTDTDLAGNVSTASPSTTVTVDTVAPTTPAAPTVATTNGTTRSFSPEVTGTAEALSIVTLYDGTKVVGSAVTATNGTYTIAPTTLSEGSHTLKVTATDAAGNISAASAGTTFTVDAIAPSTPPAPSLAAASDSGASSSDHVTNVTTPTVTGSAEAGTIVTLYDSTGAVLGQAMASSRGLYSIVATALADGPHTLSVTATDSAGNVSASSSGLSVLIDTTAPVQPAAPILAATSDSGRSSSDDITNDRTPTVTGTAEAGSTVTLYDGTKVVGSSKAAASGAYTITASPLADGVHALSVKATDLAGNVSTASNSLTVTIDTSAPATPKAPALTAASDTGLSSSDGITQDTTPTFTGTAEAGATINLYNSGVLVGTATAGSNGAYVVTSASLKDGSHAFQVTATDAAGNTSGRSATTTITVDTTAPATPAAPSLVASSDTGSSNSDGITKATTPSVSGRVSAGLVVTLYDTDGTVLGSTTADRRGNYTITSSVLAQGSHQLTVKATDAAGNVSAPSQAKTILVDTTPPNAPPAPTLVASSDTGTSSSDGLTKDTTPTFTGTAEAGARISLLNGQSVIGTATANAIGAYSVTSSALSNGAHTLTVTATDAAGNVSVASPGTTITIDTTAPARPAAPTLAAASDSGYSSKDGVTNVTTPVFTGTVEADAIVTLYDRNTVVGTGVAEADGSYAITSSTLAEGSHALHVTATDTAGNVSASSASRTITIDTIAPNVAITSAGGDVTSATQLVKGTGGADTTVTLTDNGVVVGTASVGRRGNWSETVTFASSGVHDIAATDVDAAGNVGTSNTVAYQYDPVTAASLHSLVQAMSTMTPAAAASMTPTAPAPAAEHPLAAAHT